MSRVSSFPFKVNFAIAIVSTILFIVFTRIVVGFVASLRIETLIFDIDLKLLLIAIIELIGVLVFFFYLNKKLLIPKPTNFIYYLLPFLLAVIYVFSQDYLSWFYDLVFNTNYYPKIDTGFRAPIHIKLIIARALLIPIAEELFFRKFIQKGLQECYNGYIALIVSCLLFTLAHCSDFHNMYLVFFGGLISAIIYYKSNSMIPSILFHVSWNFFVEIGVFT